MVWVVKYAYLTFLIYERYGIDQGIIFYIINLSGQNIYC